MTTFHTSSNIAVKAVEDVIVRMLISAGMVKTGQTVIGLERKIGAAICTHLFPRFVRRVVEYHAAQTTRTIVLRTKKPRIVHGSVKDGLEDASWVKMHTCAQWLVANARINKFDSVKFINQCVSTSLVNIDMVVHRTTRL